MPFMDTTQIEALLRDLEGADPADAPTAADALAAELEARLGDGDGEGGSS